MVNRAILAIFFEGVTQQLEEYKRELEAELKDVEQEIKELNREG